VLKYWVRTRFSYKPLVLLCHKDFGRREPFTPHVLKNGGIVAQLDTGAIATQTAVSAVPYFEVPVAAGDTIGANFACSTLTSTTDFYFEVLVALGTDGIGL